MQLLNLNIDKIIIHQVFRRNQDGKVKPLQSHEYTVFDHSAMTVFKRRVIDALGEGSKAVQMEIVDQCATSVSKLVDSMIDQDQETFAVSSFDIATKLADAQQTRSIPGGIVVVFTGTQGSSAKKFLGIIKAEVHTGYEKKVHPTTNEISLKFVEELLLTPGTRLYKTVGFFEKVDCEETADDLNDKWAVMISDYQISQADGKAAAKYFYEDFLGCGYPKTNARVTKQFYEVTSQFISKLSVTEVEKSHLINALTTYLKADVSNVVSASEFAQTYFNDLATQDAYTGYVKSQGLPTTAFTKDVEHVEGNLNVRKVRFGSNVRITAPSEAFKNLVEIKEIDGEPDESGVRAKWTQIIVKDRIVRQE